MSKLSHDIPDIIKNIRSDKKKMSFEELSDKYAPFKEAFVILFEMISKPVETKDDMEILDNMLLQFKNFENGQIGRYDADVKVAEVIADKYLYKDGIKK